MASLDAVRPFVNRWAHDSHAAWAGTKLWLRANGGEVVALATISILVDVAANVHPARTLSLFFISALLVCLHC